MSTPTYSFTSYSGADGNWRGFAFSSTSNIIYAVNGNAVLYKSIDGGINWSTITLPVSTGSVCCSTNGQIVYFAAANVYKSTDYGESWNILSNSGPWSGAAQRMACSSDGSVVCIPYYNSLVRVTTDGGTSWSSLGSTGIGWEQATIYNNDSIIAAIARNSPGIYISEKINGAWSNFTSTGTNLSTDQAVRIYGASTANILYYTQEGDVYKSTNKGANWSALSVPNISMVGLGCSTDGTIIAAGSWNSNRIYISVDSGTSWTLYQPSGFNNKYYHLGMAPDGKKILFASNPSSPLYIGTSSTFSLSAPSTAAAAITAGSLSTYMSSSTATSVALAAEVRAAIKAMTDATARATAKADYIAAMRAKESTLKIAVPQTDFATYIATFSNVPTAISSAAKPIDVILPSASNIVDITTASVDETKYTAIEMPVNTTMTVKDNGSTVGTLTYNGSVYTDGNGTTYSVGNSIIFGTKKVTILGQGSALVEITNTYKSIEVNLNVEISANGTLNVLGHQPTAPSNIVIASTLLPVDALYDSSNNIALIEFWEPDDRDDIMAQLASTQTLGGVEGYRITAKKLALGLQNCLIGSLDAKSAEPFNLTRYGATGVQNGNRVMTGFGRFALMAYAHYIMGHVQATAAITNDTDFMKGMLSLNSDTLTDYKYANIGNYDGAAAPWTTAGDASDANLAVRLVKTLIDNNPTTSLVSNGAATTVANIVKQVIGQDASRATDEDNNKYSPENHGLLRFYPDDVIYVSINLTTPTVTVGTGQQVSGPTMEDLYTNATGDKKYTIKLTLGPAA